MTRSKMDKIKIRGTERIAFENGQGFYKAILDKKDIEWINNISKKDTSWHLDLNKSQKQSRSKIKRLKTDDIYGCPTYLKGQLKIGDFTNG